MLLLTGLTFLQPNCFCLAFYLHAQLPCVNKLEVVTACIEEVADVNIVATRNNILAD